MSKRKTSFPDEPGKRANVERKLDCDDVVFNYNAFDEPSAGTRALWKSTCHHYVHNLFPGITDDLIPLMFSLIDFRQEAGIDNYYCIDVGNCPAGQPVG